MASIGSRARLLPGGRNEERPRAHSQHGSIADGRYPFPTPRHVAGRAKAMGFVCPDSEDQDEEEGDERGSDWLPRWRFDEMEEDEEAQPEHGDFWIDRDDDEQNITSTRNAAR